MLRDMYRRALSLALRLAAYLCLTAGALLLVAQDEPVKAAVLWGGAIAWWMGSGSLHHLRHLARMLAGYPALTTPLLAVALLAATLVPLVFAVVVLLALVLALDATQDSLRQLMRAALAVLPARAMPIISVNFLYHAAPRGVIPLPASPVPIFSPA